MTTVRPARRDDLAGVVAVMNAVDIATLGEPDTTEDDISSGWDETGFDLGADAFVVEDGNGIVGYAELYDRGEGGIFDVDVYAEPSRTHEIGPALLDAVLARAQVRAGEGSRLATWLPVGDGRMALFTGAGFAPVRQFVRMRCEVDGVQPPVEGPDGVRLREFDPDADAHVVHQVLVEAFAHHVRPLTSSFERFSEQHLEHPDFDPRYWVVAERGGEMVGAITAFNHGDIGFIPHVGVRAVERGRGIGAALVRRAVAALAESGQSRVDLGVDLEDVVGAARLYERLGFRVLQRLQLVEKQL